MKVISVRIFSICDYLLRSKECLPHIKTDYAHKLNLSSSLPMTNNWFTSHVAYPVAKYTAYTLIKGFSSTPVNLKKDKSDVKASSGGKIEGLFSKIQTAINTEISEKMNALYEFNVTGKEQGVWHIDLRTGNVAAGPGPAPSKPDATITMDSDKFFDMFTGKLKATTAFMTGKLKISGNIQKAMKLEKLLGSLRTKS